MAPMKALAGCPEWGAAGAMFVGVLGCGVLRCFKRLVLDGVALKAGEQGHVC